MPGITGIIRKDPYTEIGQDLRIMLDVMRHERFYNSGEYINKDLGLYAGWTCHRGAFSDCMPLVGRNKDVVLIFQGENYLDGETATQLRHSGNGLNESSASYLLDLYGELGDDFFLRLNGWYCGLIADLRRKRITLFNDRYGMARVYFHEGKDEFIFSSEAKSLLKVRPALRAIEPKALAEYLRFNCVIGNKSLFKGISLLPPASSWHFEGDVAVKRRSYFQFKDWEQQQVLGNDEFYQRFAETVSNVFPAYAQSRSEVACSLTAGLDTRAVMASLKHRKKPLPCYTFGGPWGELYDIRTARKIAAICDEPFSAIKVDGQFFKGFPEFARQAVYISDGTHDAFGAHDVYLNRVAREIAPIRLTGKFGSEVVRTRRLIAWETYEPGFVRPELKSLIDELRPVADGEQSRHPLTKVVSEGIPWYEFGRVAVEQSQLTLRTPYMDNNLVKLMFQAPLQIRAAGNLQEQYVKEKTPELSRLPSNLGRFVSNSPFVTKLLYFWFRALFKVEYVYLLATPHWLTHIDRTLGRLRLEKILAGRQKWEGYRIWIKTEFPEYIRQTLLNPEAQYTSFFEKSAVERMVTRHLAGTHNYLNDINKVLTVELVCSSLIRQ
jgi:asparagine synthase (glutamine-hydrolysing)